MPKANPYDPVKQADLWWGIENFNNNEKKAAEANNKTTTTTTTNTTASNAASGGNNASSPKITYAKISGTIDAGGGGVYIPANSIVALDANGKVDLTKPYTLPTGETRAGMSWTTPKDLPGGSSNVSNAGGGTSGGGTSGGGGNTTGGGNSEIPVTAADITATSSLIAATQNAAIAAAGVYGYMVKPIYNSGGNIISWEPVLDTSGNKIPTVAGGSTAAQIALFNAQVGKETALAMAEYAKMYGKVKDPETGAWVATSDKLLSDSQQALNLASAQRAADQTKMEQQNYLAQALADPNRFVEAFGLAQLQGTRAGGTGGQPGGLWGYAQNFQAGVPSGQAMGAQGVSTQSAPAATAMGVPGAVASGAGAAQGGSIGTRSVGENGQPLIALGQGPLPPGTAQTTNQLTNLAQNTQLPISGNLNAAMSGQYVPTIGNASGSQGVMTTLANVSPANGNFAKISPVVFRNLDTATQGQYGSLAQSIQGINAADLKQRVNAQLPGSAGGIPSAFKL